MTTAELHQRIIELHSQGLRVLDIAALLSVHPQIIIRALDLVDAPSK
jgi:hypothetical protein